MKSSPRPDSPLLPKLTRNVSEPTSKLVCIAEQARTQAPIHLKHQGTFLYSPTIVSTSPTFDKKHTWLDSPSPVFSYSPSTLSKNSKHSAFSLPSPPYQPLLSCLSLPDIGHENAQDNCDNWNEGWNIASMDEMRRVKSLKVYEMPIIREDDFPYYPRKELLRSCWSVDEEEEIGRLTMVGRKLGRDGNSYIGLRVWAKKILRRLGLLR